jgi:kynureninase
MTAYSKHFEPHQAFARTLDQQDPLAGYRDRFHLPRTSDGRTAIYFCSHSLGLQPKTTRARINEELESWARHGVAGHFKGDPPWYTYQEPLCELAAPLVGARANEVIFMNGLTINLHLMMTTFYRPTSGRYKILVDEPTFPSDLYAVKSQLQLHNRDPRDALLTLRPRDDEHGVRMEDIERLLMERGSEIALVLWSGVNFLTGQCFDLERIVHAAKQAGCIVGADLAHAVGNVPLSLHDWGLDFAVWCTYKYLNSGPGSIAGCFVHANHGESLDLPRLAGWWGNDPKKRFRMQLEPEFVPQPGVGGWQVSNPPILALAPVRASLELFAEVGMPALRAKSECLTAYLEYLLDLLPGEHFKILTPREPAARGCQLSLVVDERPRELLNSLEAEGAVVDFREPNIIRVAPAPLYNSFQEVWTFAQILSRHVA